MARLSINDSSDRWDFSSKLYLGNDSNQLFCGSMAVISCCNMDNHGQHTILPSIALAMMPMAYIARLMRSSMLEVLGQDYILTAKAKGLNREVSF